MTGWLTACAGGSGSSGFDAAPRKRRHRHAVSEQRCVTPSGVDDLSGRHRTCPHRHGYANSDATAADLYIHSGLDAATTHTTDRAAQSDAIRSAHAHAAAQPQRPRPPLPCLGCGSIPASARAALAGGLSASALQLHFAFAPDGFPPTAIFRVAVRTDTDGAWHIGARRPAGSPSAPSLDAPVNVRRPPIYQPRRCRSRSWRS